LAHKTLLWVELEAIEVKVLNNLFQTMLAVYGHTSVAIMAYRVTIWGQECKEHYG
jgi:hypothetical protein